MSLSATMDLPLTELMRAAVLLSPHPDLRAVQERIIASVQVLEATRITLQAVEHLVELRPIPASEPAVVVSLSAVRDARAGAVQL